MDPAEHYLWIGRRLGRKPSSSFSSPPSSGVGDGIQAAPGGTIPPRRNRRPDGKKRITVFASYSSAGVVEPYVKAYLNGLAEITDHIIFVADNDLLESESASLADFVSHSITGRHGEYDFGSYKRGLQYARKTGLLEAADELILCNDSCYGPVGSFSALFDSMSSKEYDFWGLTSSTQFQPHIQSYFVLFKKDVIHRKEFLEFFESVKVEKSVEDVVKNYEVKMSRFMENLGFKWGCYIDRQTPGHDIISSEGPNLTLRPRFLLSSGCPLVKVKALTKVVSNDDGIGALLEDLRKVAPELYPVVSAHSGAEKYLSAKEIGFSIIMPVYNRASVVGRAIRSALTQNHSNKELIIVDDGSSDGTADRILADFGSYIEEGVIVLKRLEGRSGVSAARNAGLSIASKSWISYLDSDNTLEPGFLSVFADAIIANPQASCFYARWRNMFEGGVRGVPFDRARLYRGNYIDLGVFVHSRALYEKLGGFDENLKRLVDWDLIVRLTKSNEPVFINRSLMRYNDDKEDRSRITVKESLDVARQRVRQKNNLPFRVSTIIPAYNHQEFIVQAMESAVNQTGAFEHEIIVCSDGSTDRTGRLIEEFSAKNPGVIRNLSVGKNRGISETFRRCISAATGDYIAVLEGDDIWVDRNKLSKQLSFMMDNLDCVMVFSKIIVRRLPSLTDSFLPRQVSITKNKLDGSDFLRDPSMNLIANFSSCFFRAGIMQDLPKRLFDSRFNEIALVFHLERYGKIGFMDEPMSIYHQHPAGVWTGSSREEQLRSGLQTRQMVLDVADPKYHDAIERIIEEKYRSQLAKSYSDAARASA